MSFEAYMLNPVCFLSPYNYKVNAAVGVTKNNLKNYLSIFDTGAGPNIVRSDILNPTQLQNLDTRTKVANLASASNHPLNILGVIYLYVKINGYLARQPFIVVSDLSCDVLLGCTYIDEHTENIWVRRRTVVLRDGTTAPIQRRHSPTLYRKENEPVDVEPDEPPPRVIRVAQQRILPPQTEVTVSVVIKESGTFLLESSQRLYNKHQCSIANGIVTTTADRPFLIKIANFSNTSVPLRKGQILGTATASPVIGYMMPNEKEPGIVQPGYLENIYTGKKVSRADLHDAPDTPSSPKKSCLLKHLTGHLFDQTCQSPNAGEEESNLFNIPYNENFIHTHTETQTCPCCQQSVGSRNKNYDKNNNFNSKNNHKNNFNNSVFITTSAGELQRPSSYPPVPREVLNKIPTAPEKQNEKVSTEEKYSQ